MSKNQTMFNFGFVPVASGESDDSIPTRFSGIPYSGGMIPGYGDLGDVAIDLSTLKSPKKEIFALVNHDPDQRAGHCSFTNNGTELKLDGRFSKATPSGKMVASEFCEGAPWEFSVRINGTLEHYKEKKEFSVNGQNMFLNGIFRNASVREVSFVPAGADPNTVAVAFERTEQTDALIPTETIQEESCMDYEDLINQLRWMLNLPKLSTPEEIQAELGKLFSQVANAPADMSSTTKGLTALCAERFSGLQEQITQSQQRAAQFESELVQFKRDSRVEKVKALFSDLQRDFKEETANPYITMDDATFEIISADMRSVKTPMLHESFFQDTAVNGRQQSMSTIESERKLFNQVAGVKN